MKMTPATIEAGAVALLGLALLIMWARAGSLGGAGQAAGQAAGEVIVGAAGGVIVGIGNGVGVPATSMTECERAKMEGRTWDASFACPASDFLGWWWEK